MKGRFLTVLVGFGGNRVDYYAQNFPFSSPAAVIPVQGNVKRANHAASSQPHAEAGVKINWKRKI